MTTGTAKLRKTLSLNIKKRRKLLGISQEKLAEIAGLSLQTINGIEGCRLWVSDSTLVKIAEALQNEPFELLVPENSAVSQEIKTAPGGRLPLEILLGLQQNLQSALQKSVKTTIDAKFLELLKITSS